MVSLPSLAEKVSSFGAIVANPPYQTEVVKNATRAEQKTVMNVFHHFQELASTISQQNSMVYPGARWINPSGKGLASFGLQQVNSSSLKTVLYWKDSTNVFKDIILADGLTVVHRVETRQGKTWKLHYLDSEEKLSLTNTIRHPGDTPFPLDPRVRAIVERVTGRAHARGASFLENRTTPQKTFGLESNFVSLNPHLVRPLDSPPPQSEINNWCKFFGNDVAGKAGRATWLWLPRSE